MNDNSWHDVRPSDLVAQVHDRAQARLDEERERVIDIAGLTADEIAQLVA